jgi:hypothetical protein
MRTTYRRLLVLALAGLAAIPSASLAFGTSPTPHPFDAVLPPINEGALMMQGSRYRAIAGSNSQYFIEGKRLNYIKRGSPSDVLETFGLVLEDAWAPTTRGYLDGRGLPHCLDCSSRFDTRSMKVVRSHTIPDSNHSAVLTRDGRVFLLPSQGDGAPRQIDEGVGQLTFELFRLPSSDYLLLYIKADRRLIETRISPTTLQVTGSRTVMTLPSQVHNPKLVTVFTNSGVQYSACGIDPGLTVYCTGVLRVRQSSSTSSSSIEVLERTTGAHYMGSNILHFDPARNSIIGQAMNTSGQWFRVGSAEAYSAGGAYVTYTDFRGLTYEETIPDNRKAEVDVAAASRPSVAVSYTRGGSPKLYAVAPNRQMYSRQNQLGSWYGWNSEPGSYLVSKPVVAVRRDVTDWNYQGDVFYVGGDRGVYYMRTTDRVTFALGGVKTSNPSAVSWGGNRLDVFVRGTDDGLWHRGTDDTTNWFGWERVAGNVAGDPVAVSWGPMRLDIFYRGTDNALWQAWWDGSWHSRSFGGYVVGEPSVISYGPGHLDVFYRGGDNALWHGWSRDGTNQFGWESLSGVLTSSPVAVARSANQLDVFVRGADGALWRCTWAGAGWSWHGHGGYIEEGPFAAEATFDRYGLEVFYKGADWNLWRHSWNNGWKAENFGLFE